MIIRRSAAAYVSAMLVLGGLFTIVSPAAAAVATPAISAPPDVVVGEAAGAIHLPVRLSDAGTSTVTVAYTTPGISATSGTNCPQDYLGATGTLTFAPGVTAQEVTVNIRDCPADPEGIETFTVTLSLPTNATIARAVTRVDIVDNDTTSAAPPLFVRDAVADEGAGTVSVPVLLGGTAGRASSGSTVTVHYATSNGTATAGSDYTATSGTLTFAVGQTVQTIPVAITNDAAPEPSERLTVTLTSPTGGATILDATAALVIGASDAAPVATPAISAGPDVVVGEADGYLDVPVSLSAPPSGTATVMYSIAGISATSGTNCPQDFIGAAAPIKLTFLPGETTRVVRTELYDCPADPEGIETFTVTLSLPTNATIARAVTRVDIVDNDTTSAAPPLFVRDAVADEGAGTVSVPVLLGGTAGRASSGSTVTVHYATSNGTATAGSDYTATSGTLTFAVGQTVQTIPVAITNDAAPEPSERLTVTLTSPTGGATILDATAALVIGASDAAPVATPAISAGPDVVVGEADGYLDVPVSLSAPPSGTATVMYSIAGISATSGTNCPQDFIGAAAPIKLTFLPGETTRVVRTELYDCPADPEGIETFTVTLSLPTNATIARAVTRVDIVDNDTTSAAPPLFVRDAVADEGAGTVSVPVLLGGTAGRASSGSTVTVHYATSNGTATAGSDYTATSGTLTFAVGQTVQTIPVAITNDAAPEPSERLTVTLTSPTGGATILDATAALVIGASDAAPVATPAISAGPDVVVGEADGYLDVPVSLSAPPSGTATVMYSIAGISATSGTNCPQDFIGAAAPIKLTFLPGETTRVVRTELYDCPADPEGIETFTVTLSLPTNATIARAVTRVDIVDNDNGVNVYSYGIGDDTYTVVALTDVIIENPGGGTDTVQTSLTYTLPTNLERLVLTGASARNGTGNAANNKITGNSAANKLNGLNGNDTLIGGDGADTLTGGNGADTITGGPGADIIVFDSLSGSDTVTDFSTVDDTFRIRQAGIHIGNGDSTVNGAVTRGAPGGFAASAELAVFTSDIVGDITTASAAATIGSATTAYAAGDDRLFVVDNGTSTGIFRFHSSGANAQVSAAELTLIAKVAYDGATTSTSVTDYSFAP